MGPEPLARVRGLGLTQQELAALLGVSQQAISQWARGSRQLPTFVEGDLWELARLIEERMGAGLTVHQAVSDWKPTFLWNKKSGPTFQGHPIRASAESIAALERGDISGADAIILRDVTAALADAACKPLDAEQLAIIRRLLLTVNMQVDGFLKVDGLLKEGRHAHTDQP